MEMTMEQIKNLVVGDFVYTNYSTKWTRHRILNIREGMSQTGILFEVAPSPLNKKMTDGDGTLYDAGWFITEKMYDEMDKTK